MPIRTEDRHRFHLRLGDQELIEGIAVVLGKLGDVKRTPMMDRERGHAGVDHYARDVLRGGSGGSGAS